MSRESYLTNLFCDAARRYKKEKEGKILAYKFYTDATGSELIAKGKGYLVSCYYDESIDCNVYTIEDSNTGERYIGNQFRFMLN